MSENAHTYTFAYDGGSITYDTVYWPSEKFDWRKSKYADAVAKFLESKNQVITFDGKKYQLTAVLWNEVKKGDTLYKVKNTEDAVPQMYLINRVCNHHYRAKDVVTHIEERLFRPAWKGVIKDDAIETHPSYELVATPYINIFQHIVLPPLTPKEELVYGVYRNTLDKFNKETIDVLKEIIDEKDDIINQLSDALRVADNKEMKFIKLYRRVEYTERIKWRIEQEQKDSEAL